MARPRNSDTVDPQLVRFGQTLRRARQDAGLTQDALARHAGLSQSEVSLLETARREPALLSVIALARALHMTPSELIQELR